MKKKRSIILISILIIVSAVIYFYKPQHNKNNSYQLGIIISIGNKDKSNILYYNDQLQKTGVYTFEKLPITRAELVNLLTSLSVKFISSQVK